MTDGARGVPVDNQQAGTTAITPARRWGGLAILLLGVLVVVMDQTITAVVLPHLSADLGIGVDAASVTITVFIISSAIALTVMGQLADALGRRRMVILGFIGFAVGSLITAMANDFTVLLVGRVVQGLMFAVISPSILGLVNIAFPDGRARTLAFSLWSTTTASAVAIGPVVGGAFATLSSWRDAFFINVPLCAAVVIGAWLLVPRDRPDAADLMFDLPGIALLALTMTALVIGFQEGTAFGWFEATGGFAIDGLSPVPFILAVAMVAGVALVLVERQRARAGRRVLLDPRILSVATFRIGLLSSALMSMALYGLMILVPIYLQFVEGASALEAGATLFVFGAGMVTGGFLSTPVVNRFGRKRTALTCSAFQVVFLSCLVVMVRVGGTSPAAAALLVGYGICYTLAFAALMNTVLSDVPRALSSRAAGMTSTLRLGCDALATAAIVGVMVAVTSLVAAGPIASGKELSAADRATLTELTHFQAGAGQQTINARKTLPRLAREPETAPIVAAVRESFVDAGRAGIGVAILFVLGALAFGIRLPPDAQRRIS